MRLLTIRSYGLLQWRSGGIHEEYPVSQLATEHGQFSEEEDW